MHRALAAISAMVALLGIQSGMVKGVEREEGNRFRVDLKVCCGFMRTCLASWVGPFYMGDFFNASAIWILLSSSMRLLKAASAFERSTSMSAGLSR